MEQALKKLQELKRNEMFKCTEILHNLDKKYMNYIGYIRHQKSLIKNAIERSFWNEINMIDSMIHRYISILHEKNNKLDTKHFEFKKEISYLNYNNEKNNIDWDRY